MVEEGRYFFVCPGMPSSFFPNLLRFVLIVKEIENIF
jgi:hypothetical protein